MALTGRFRTHGLSRAIYDELRGEAKSLTRALLNRLARSLLVVLVAIPLIHSRAQAPSSAVETAEPRNISVFVADENGIAVPDAQVQLKGPQLSNALQCETDFTGHCQFGSISGNYEINVGKTGFYTLSVPVNEPGTTLTLHLTLTHQQAIHETVNVVESTPAIDPAQISSREELTASELIDIPYGGPHDYHNALTFIPGTAPDAFGQFHVAGAEVYQTLTLLDGFNVTQPATGQLDVRTAIDSFRSITVDPSREPAEFGKGSGGVLGLNTAMSDDHYRFVGTDFIPSLQNTKGIALNSWTPIFTVAGPVVKGRVWFIDSLDGEYDNIIIPQLPSGSDSDRPWRVDNLAKLQANLTTQNVLKFSFLSNYLHDPNDGISFLSPATTTPNDEETAYIGSVKDLYSFKDETLLETGFGFARYNVALTPEGSLPYFVGDEGNAGNYYLNERSTAERLQGIANLYLSPHYWHGRHEIRIGTDLDRLRYEASFIRQPISFLRAGQTLSANETCLSLLPSPCARYSTFSGGGPATTYNSEASGYTEDRWLIHDRFLLEPGVRLDWDQIVRKFLVSPRLAGTYVLDSEGNTKLSAGVGVIYDSTQLGLIAQPLEGQRVDYFFNGNGNPVDVNGNPAPQPVPAPTQFFANRNTLTEPRYLNWSLALEKRLPWATFLKAEFIEKRGVDGFAYNTLNGGLDGTYLFGNTRDDRYDGFTISARHNFHQHYAIYGAYTRSRAHTNEAFDFSLDFPLLSSQRSGPYPWDVPDRFVGWGILPVSRFPIVHAFDIVYSAEARNGLPFNVTNDQQVIAAPPGTFRLPAYYAINLAFEKRIHLFGFYWAARAGFLNVTNHANPAVADSIVDSQHPLPTFVDQAGRGFDFRLRLLGRK